MSIGTAAIIAQSESLRHFSPQGSGSGKAGAFFLRPQSQLMAVEALGLARFIQFERDRSRVRSLLLAIT